MGYLASGFEVIIRIIHSSENAGTLSILPRFLKSFLKPHRLFQKCAQYSRAHIILFIIIFPCLTLCAYYESIRYFNSAIDAPRSLCSNVLAILS